MRMAFLERELGGLDRNSCPDSTDPDAGGDPVKSDFRMECVLGLDPKVPLPSGLELEKYQQDAIAEILKYWGIDGQLLVFLHGETFCTRDDRV